MRRKKPSLKPLWVPLKPHYDAFSWCDRRYIRVYCKVQKDGSYKLIREDQGKVVFISKDTFDKSIVDQKIWEFYKYIFDNKK